MIRMNLFVTSLDTEILIWYTICTSFEERIAMLIFQLNGNQISTLAELNKELNELNYFNVQLTYSEQESRTVVARFYKFGEPGWLQYEIDHNGDRFHGVTGGLD